MKQEKTVEKKNVPETKFRAGQITATVWGKNIEVNKKEVRVYNVSIEKSYKDKDDEWQTTNSYGREDLVKVRLVIDKSIEYLYLNEDNEKQ